MKDTICEYFEAELSRARSAIARDDFDSAWTALQRSHILAQAFPLTHAIRASHNSEGNVHWQMLRLAWKQRDFKELSGHRLFLRFASRSSEGSLQCLSPYCLDESED